MSETLEKPSNEENPVETMSGDSMFPLLGISLTFLERLVRKRDPNRRTRTFKGLTTAQVIAQFILPTTAGPNLSFAELVKTNDSSQVNLPTHFVCHSWDSSFSALVAALGHQFGGLDKSDIFLWLDMFSLNLHQCKLWMQDKSMYTRWYHYELWKGIRTIGRFLLVADPWENPYVLQQSCTLWEMLATLSISPNGEEWQVEEGSKPSFIPVSVCMTHKQRAEFLIEIANYRKVERMMESICAVNSAEATPAAQNDPYHHPAYVRLLLEQWQGWPSRVNSLVQNIMGEFLNRQTLAQLKYMQDRADQVEESKVRRHFGHQCRLLKHMVSQFVTMGMYDHAVTLCSWVYSANRDKYGREDYIDQALWTILDRLGDLMMETLRFHDAITVCEEALKLVPNEPQCRSLTISQLALAKTKLKLFAEAESLYAEALELDRIHFPDSTTLATSLANLGDLFVERNEINPAIQMFQESLDLNLKLRNIDNDTLTRDVYSLGKLYLRVGEFDKALALFEKNIILRGYSLDLKEANSTRIREQSKDASLAEDMRAVCICLLRQNKDLQRASQYGIEVIKIHSRSLGETHKRIGDDLSLMAQIEMNLGFKEKSKRLENKALEVAFKSWRSAIQPAHHALLKLVLKRKYFRLCSLIEENKQAFYSTKVREPVAMLKEADALEECATTMLLLKQPKGVGTLLKACRLRIEALGPGRVLSDLLEVVSLVVRNGSETDRETVVPFMQLLEESTGKMFSHEPSRMKSVLNLRGALGTLLLKQGALELAAKLLVPALQKMSALLGESSRESTQLMRTVSKLFVEEGKLEKAIALLHHARKHAAPDEEVCLQVELELASVLMIKANRHQALHNQLSENGREASVEELESMAKLENATAIAASDVEEICGAAIPKVLKRLGDRLVARYPEVEASGADQNNQTELNEDQWRLINAVLEKHLRSLDAEVTAELLVLANWYWNFAEALRASEDYETADLLLRRVLTIQMKMHGADDVAVKKTAQLLEVNFAELEAAMDDYDEGASVLTSESFGGTSTSGSDEDSSDGYTSSGPEPSSEASDVDSLESEEEHEKSETLPVDSSSRNNSEATMPPTVMIREESVGSEQLIDAKKVADSPIIRLLRQASAHSDARTTTEAPSTVFNPGTTMVKSMMMRQDSLYQDELEDLVPTKLPLEISSPPSSRLIPQESHSNAVQSQDGDASKRTPMMRQGTFGAANGAEHSENTSDAEKSEGDATGAVDLLSRGSNPPSAPVQRTSTDARGDSPLSEDRCDREHTRNETSGSHANEGFLGSTISLSESQMEEGALSTETTVAETNESTPLELDPAPTASVNDTNSTEKSNPSVENTCEAISTIGSPILEATDAALAPQTDNGITNLEDRNTRVNSSLIEQRNEVDGTVESTPPAQTISDEGRVANGKDASKTANALGIEVQTIGIKSEISSDEPGGSIIETMNDSNIEAGSLAVRCSTNADQAQSSTNDGLSSSSPQSTGIGTKQPADVMEDAGDVQPSSVIGEQLEPMMEPPAHGKPAPQKQCVCCVVS